jgi:hypothetical protein
VSASPRGVVAIALAGGRQQRHERLREGTLGEQPAQQIGNAKGDLERVHHRRGAEQRRADLVAHQARDA